MRIEIFKNKEHPEKESFPKNPDFYWELMLFAAFIIIISSFIFGFYLFYKINRDPLFKNENAGGNNIGIEKERIDKALEYFSDREKKSVEIINSPSPLIDPSL